MTKPRVFISYKSVQADRVKRVAEALLKEGFALFIDNPSKMGWTADEAEKNDILYIQDMDWDSSLLEALPRVDAVLGCLSKEFSGTNGVWVDEIRKAYDANKLVTCIVDETPADSFDDRIGFFKVADLHKRSVWSNNALDETEFSYVVSDLKSRITKKSSGGQPVACEGSDETNKKPLKTAVDTALTSIPMPLRERLQIAVDEIECCKSLDKALQEILDGSKDAPSESDRTRLNTLARCLFAQYLSSLNVISPAQLSARNGGHIVPTGHISAAEAFIAAAEGRVPEYNQDGTGDPPGKRNLNAPPPKSFSREEEPDEFAELEGRLGTDLVRFKEATARALNRRTGYLLSTENRDYLRKAIVAKLKRNYSDRRFYLAYETSIEGLERAIETIEQDYEGLVPVLKMNSEDAFAEDLFDPLHTLADILSLEERGNSTNET